MWSRCPCEPRGKVNRFRGKVRHFPGRERLQVRRERHVEPVPHPPRGKVHRFRRKTRHFPGRWEWQVRRERPVEPAPLSATGESEPFSQESPALSPGVEMPSATRVACGAGTHASHGGKCTVFAGKTRHFPRGSRTRGEKTQRWDEMLNEMKR